MPAPVQASLTTALAGANNDLVFTSRWNAGKTIRVTYVDPGAIDFDGAVLVKEDGVQANIIVVLKRTSGAITMTAAEVKAAIEAHPVANALVGVANAGADNGSGAVIALAVTALSGGVDPSFANQGEVETRYRTIGTWGAGSVWESECIVRGGAQRIRSADTEANHRARLNEHYLELAQKGGALDRF